MALNPSIERLRGVVQYFWTYSVCCALVGRFTFMGLWLSVVVLPNTPVPPVPNPELVPNKLIVH